MQKLLKVPSEEFRNVLSAVRERVVCPENREGSTDFSAFMRRVKTCLLKDFERRELMPFLAGICGNFGLGRDYAEKALQVREPVTKTSDNSSAGNWSSASAAMGNSSTGDDVNFSFHNREMVNWVEVELKNAAVRVEAGALRYAVGDLEMELKSGGLEGFFKSALSGESGSRPVYRGTGKLVLEPSFSTFFELQLDKDDDYILDFGAYFASELSVEISAVQNKAMSAVFSGQGVFQTRVKGPGLVILSCPGPVEKMVLENSKLIVDGSFAVARSSSLNFDTVKSGKNLLTSFASGEGFINTLQGSGTVFLTPVPGRKILETQLKGGNRFFGSAKN
jgi:uncharacterized protein (AIM24 family)